MLGPGALGPSYVSPLGAGFAGPTAGAFIPSPAYAVAPPSAYAVAPPAAYAVAPPPFAPAAAFAPAYGAAAAYAPPAAFAAPPTPFAAPPTSFAAPPTVFAAPQVSAERPVGAKYIEALRPTPQVLQGLAGLLRQLEASLPLSEVTHSLHVQAEQIPEVAAQPQFETFGKAAREALHAEVAATGFIRRMLCGDFSPQVVQGVREQMREAARFNLEAEAAFRELLARPASAQHPVLQVLRQSLIQAHQIRRVTLGQGQLLGIAPLPEAEET